MKQNYMHHRVVSVLVSLIMVGAAVPLHAIDERPDKEEAALPAAPAATVLITEVQTGAATAGDEFIELYNQSAAPVAIGGWQVRYLNATATDVVPTLVATINEAVVLPPRTHYVLHTPLLPLAAGVLGQQYDATLSSRDKVVALFVPDTATCQARVHDAVGWGASTHGEGAAVPHADSVTDKYIYRYVHPIHGYVDTNSNKHDAGIGLATTSIATMGALNSQVLPEGQQDMPGAASSLSPVTIKGCDLPAAPEPPAPTPPAPPVPPATSPPAVIQPAEEEEDAPPKPVLPERNVGLRAPQISELLPNPTKPQTDAADEFIELYNSNGTAFELSGFMLEVGTTTKKRYTFPQGTMLAPKAFQAFMSKDTKLSLSNTTGQARLLDPFGAVISESEPYQTAKDGQAWLTADNTWQWTTVPTPGAINVVKTPASTKKASTEKAATAASAAGSVKGASATSAQTADLPSKAAEQPAAENGGFNPLHPGILALTGVLAVLYAIYEYRRDLANKFHQFRANRAARRNLRQKSEGR